MNPEKGPREEIISQIRTDLPQFTVEAHPDARVRARVCVSRSVVSDSRKLHDCTLPSSSVCGILQARTLEQVVPRETGLILRCAGKAGNPFQTTQG